MIYLDTHVVLWLLTDLDSIPARSRDLIEHEEVKISPMVTLELQYLHEIGRIRATADHVVNRLLGAIGLTECSVAFSSVSATARTLSWTNDPFDRLIVAQAITGGAGLITKDSTISDNFPGAVWD